VTHSNRSLLALSALCLLLTSPAWCQLPRGVRVPKVKIEGVDLPQVALPSIGDLIKEEPPLTTTLSDGSPRVTILDGWEPSSSSVTGEAAWTAEAGFSLTPGTYRLELDSFCLHAGSHGPSKHTEGYLEGPFRGRRAELLQQVIRRYTVTPAVSRQETQALLWSILARSDLSKVTGPAREAAEKLLTPQELADLGGGPWASLSSELKREIRKQLSPAQRAIFDAEDKLRDLIAKPTAGYAQLERVAVRSGNPPRSDSDIALPDRCWCLHSGGSLVRYEPHGYSNTTVQVHVPSPIGVERDGEGRISRLWDAWGGVVEVGYADGDAQRGPRLREVRICDSGDAHVLSAASDEGGAPSPEALERLRRAEAFVQQMAPAAAASSVGEMRDAMLLTSAIRALQAASTDAVPEWADDVLDAMDDGVLALLVAAAGRPVVDPPAPPSAPSGAGSGQPGGGSPGSTRGNGQPGGSTSQPGGDGGSTGPGSGGAPEGNGGNRPDAGGNGQPAGGGTDTPNGGAGPAGTRDGNQPGGGGNGQPGGEGTGTPDGGGNPGGTRDGDQPGGDGESGQPGDEGTGTPDGGTPDGTRDGGQPGGDGESGQPSDEGTGTPDGDGTPDGTRDGGQSGGGRGHSRRGSGGGRSTVKFDPTDGIALPGTTGRQRLGISGRPSGEQDGGTQPGADQSSDRPRRHRGRPNGGRGSGTPDGSGGNTPDGSGSPDGGNVTPDGGGSGTPDGSGGNNPDGSGSPDGGNVTPDGGGSGTPDGGGGNTPDGSGSPDGGNVTPDGGGPTDTPGDGGDGTPHGGQPAGRG